MAAFICRLGKVAMQNPKCVKLILLITVILCAKYGRFRTKKLLPRSYGLGRNLGNELTFRGCRIWTGHSKMLLSPQNHLRISNVNAKLHIFVELSARILKINADKCIFRGTFEICDRLLFVDCFFFLNFAPDFVKGFTENLFLNFFQWK